MTWTDDPALLARKLSELRQEHRDLDMVIDQLSNSGAADELTLKRLKKRKLGLKDMINWIENKLLPDQPA
jgi:hypothetical protein